MASALNDVARLYRNLGRYDEAEPPYKKALEIRVRKLGPNRPTTIETSKDLADLLRTQGRPDVADTPLKRIGVGTP